MKLELWQIPGTSAQVGDGLGECHVARLLEPGDGVAMAAAPEAMIVALLLIDLEARRLLLMERAETFAMSIQSNLLTYQCSDRDEPLHLVDAVWRDGLDDPMQVLSGGRD